jgi:hypothetical protein
LTLQVDLPGGQSRLRQIILYVAEKCRNAEYFGAVKLNKIIWKADFNSYADRQKPVTGREYRRQMFGPVPKELIWVQDEMLKDGAIYLDFRDFGNGYIEKRTIALDRANLDPFFDEIDLGYVDRSIDYYWPMTGVESSDESHGVAWKTRKNGDPMPYELAFLSDAPVQPEQLKKIQALIKDRQLTSV